MDRFRIVAIVMIWAMLLGQGECERMDQMQKKNPAASQGADTEALRSLRLSLGATSLNKDHNTTLSLTGTYADGTQKDLSAQAKWLVTPQDAIKITGHTLMALKDVNVTLQAQVGKVLSNPVHLEIYWEVDGHRLPPEPDPKVNNATLLGVDVNHNGVRDDVERWIYKTYKHPIERGLILQVAYAFQKVILNPQKAHETVKYINNSLSCYYYLFDTDNYIREKYKYRYLGHDLKKIQFNTIKRHIAYERYNGEFNGEVFSSQEANQSKCLFDANGNLKE